MLRKLELMHALFGECPEHRCGECRNLEQFMSSRSIFKCRAYGITWSEASDWRKKWTACGLFDTPYDGSPAMETRRLCVLKKHRESQPQIDGQIEMEG